MSGHCKKEPKFDKNAHNFLHSDSNSIKSTFLGSCNQYLSSNIYFVWFPGGPNFAIAHDTYHIKRKEYSLKKMPFRGRLILGAIVFGNDVIMTLFDIIGLSN